MLRCYRALSLLVLSGVLAGSHVQAAEALRAIPFNIVFENGCDGLDLRIRDRLGVTGTHTGCGQNERVRGDQFLTDDDELGLTVQYFDRTLRRQVEIEVFRTGFRAGNYYVYDVRSGDLLRYGNWEPAPPAP